MSCATTSPSCKKAHLWSLSCHHTTSMSVGTHESLRPYSPAGLKTFARNMSVNCVTLLFKKGKNASPYCYILCRKQMSVTVHLKALEVLGYLSSKSHSSCGSFYSHTVPSCETRHHTRPTSALRRLYHYAQGLSACVGEPTHSH